MADRPPRLLGEDEELLAKVRGSRIGETFDYLWDNPPPYGEFTKRGGDVALCGYMAFWIGYDEDRIDRIFRLSKRCTSEWDSVVTCEGNTYGEMVIRRALARQKAFHKDAAPARKDATTPTSMSDALATRLREEVTTDAA